MAIMEVWFKRLFGGKLRQRELMAGDVVSVGNGGLFRFRQFGIWTGADIIGVGVFHGRKQVQRVELRRFRTIGEPFRIYEFASTYSRPSILEVKPNGVVMDNWEEMYDLCRKMKQYHCYTPDETIQRAESSLGKTGFISSEHFALWCKTGIAESHQLQDLEKILGDVKVY